MQGTTLSHYRIEAELGRGGMGVVYRAVDVRLDRTVAVKVLPKQVSQSADARARFIREAKTASALDHPVICTVHDIGEADDGSIFMVMPFYDGMTLRERIEEGPLPSAEIVRIAEQIADGLSAAHAAGIVHRDIKPANIILTKEGRVKILDFGVAKMAEGVALTREGSTVGTAFYMSPEQARGEEAGERSDLWSLGVVLYELATGRRPFRGDYDAAAAYSIINEDPDPLPASVPAALAAVITELLSKDPAARPASAGVVRDRLGSEANGGQTATTLAVATGGSGTQRIGSEVGSLRAAADSGAGSGNQTPAGSRPRLLLWALGAVLVLVIGALGIVFGHAGGEDASEGPLDAIAVFPFDVQAGPDLAYLDRGMVSMLSPMIDGVGGIRAIDPKMVLGLMEQRGDSYIDPVEGQRLAGEFGADRFILGSISRLGSKLQLAATLYDASGTALAEDVETVDTEDDLLPATSRVVIELMGAVLSDRDSAFDTGLLSTTESFPAMKAYVQAEEAYRAGRFEEASDLADDAIEQDSTFAAALFLAANARAQFFGNHQPYRLAAVRHSQNAPERLREHIRIRAEAVDVGGQETIRRLKRLRERYPDDLDMMGYIADQTYHKNPRYGRSDSEAIPLFLELLRYDPDNGEYLYHLAPMLYRERRFETLDSLYQALRTLADMPQLEPVEVLRTLALGDREAAIDSAAGSPSWSVMAGLQESQDLEAMDAVQDRWLVSVEEFSGPWAAAWFGRTKLVRGQPVRWHARVVDAALVDSVALGDFLLSSSLPYLALSPDSIQAIRSLMAHSNVDGWVGDAVLPRQAFQYPGDSLDAGAYARGMFAHRIGDLAWLRDEVVAVERRANGPESTWMTRNTHIELKARLLAAEGDPAGALQALDAYEPVRSNLQQTTSVWQDGASARMLRAQLLLALGRPEEAIAWSQSVHEAVQNFPPVWLPTTYLLEAEAHEQLGDWGRAVERYDRLLALWNDPDPEMRPQVEEAKRRREQVLDRLAREQGS